ncbi:MAG: glycosyltransferase [Candidatus ainarchaeum sp.]|nr:glycosyltransferase [Candidatus ainarchaeum sp.]
MEKVIAVIFAFNEQQSLPRTLSILNLYKKKGIIHEIVVIDDGSIDNTAKIAKNKGAIVVSHPRNLGKRESFISGANKARELGGQIMINLDADLIKFPEQTLKEMISAVSNGKKLMAVAQQYEKSFSLKRAFHTSNDFLAEERFSLSHFFKNGITNSRYSKVDLSFFHCSNGQRAINLIALEPLFRKNNKWMQVFKTKKPIGWRSATKSQIKQASKYGLESALDDLIPINKVIDLHNSPIFTSKPFRKGNPYEVEYIQNIGRNLSSAALLRRSKQIKKIRRHKK